jgi:hypothetical protein
MKQAVGERCAKQNDKTEVVGTHIIQKGKFNSIVNISKYVRILADNMSARSQLFLLRNAKKSL